jgi:hypothetical protein
MNEETKSLPGAGLGLSVADSAARLKKARQNDVARVSDAMNGDIRYLFGFEVFMSGW